MNKIKNCHFIQIINYSNYHSSFTSIKMNKQIVSLILRALNVLRE